MYVKNQIISTTITGFAPYGVFVKAGDYVGLIHISEISDRYVKDIYEFASIGDVVDVMVLDIDEENKQLKLSYKKCRHKRKIKIKPLQVGFKTLEDNLEKQIEAALSEIGEDID
ncbi:MAG: S1 RNA-binding domain-containing protein [Acholeplasmataceae bacterium]